MNNLGRNKEIEVEVSYFIIYMLQIRIKTIFITSYFRKLYEHGKTIEKNGDNFSIKITH